MEENTTIEVKKENVKEKVQTWGEKHPKLKKAAKGVGIGLGALAVGTLGFFLGKRSSSEIPGDECPPDVSFDID